MSLESCFVRYVNMSFEPARYFGSEVFQHDPMKSDYKTNFWMPLKENGEIVWFLAPDLKKRQYDW